MHLLRQSFNQYTTEHLAYPIVQTKTTMIDNTSHSQGDGCQVTKVITAKQLLLRKNKIKILTVYIIVIAFCL